MYEFIAVYIDRNTGKEYSEKITINQEEQLPAWERGVKVAITHNRGGLLFSKLELLSIS